MKLHEYGDWTIIEDRPSSAADGDIIIRSRTIILHGIKNNSDLKEHYPKAIYYYHTHHGISNITVYPLTLI